MKQYEAPELTKVEFEVTDQLNSGGGTIGGDGSVTSTNW